MRCAFSLLKTLFALQSRYGGSMTEETVNPKDAGYLVGGPFDGVTFSTARNFWRSYQPRLMPTAGMEHPLPRPAERVYVYLATGEVHFWWPGCNLLSDGYLDRVECYVADQDHPGWVYRHVDREAARALPSV